jgi:hypothetical protein
VETHDRDGRVIQWNRKIRADMLAKHQEVDASIGKRFGELVVTRRDPRTDQQRKLRVFVRCDCGAEKSIPYRSLATGNSTTCGTAMHRDRDRLARGEGMVGQRYGLLTVVLALAEGDSGRTQVLVRCDCGVERRAIVSDLAGGGLQSCGGDAHRTLKPQSKRWTVAGKYTTYAVEAVGTGMVKIGRARDVEERIRDLQTACPVELGARRSDTSRGHAE